MARTHEFRAHWLTGAALAVAVILSVPAVAQAESGAQAGYWLASTPSVADGMTWGRLVVKNGVLAFHSSRDSWETPLNEIKRVSVSKASDRIIEIETVAGEVLTLSILGPNMLVESPRKAMQHIQRAVREAPAPAQRPALAATNAGGGGGIR
jgi:hypothetical protein